MFPIKPNKTNRIKVIGKGGTGILKTSLQLAYFDKVYKTNSHLLKYIK